jgi:hypothetical protein
VLNLVPCWIYGFIERERDREKEREREEEERVRGRELFFGGKGPYPFLPQD